MEGPLGMMIPATGSSYSQTVLTPVLPENVDLANVKGNSRNYVCTTIRVLSPVHGFESMELINCWRLTTLLAACSLQVDQANHTAPKVLAKEDEEKDKISSSPTQLKKHQSVISQGQTRTSSIN